MATKHDIQAAKNAAKGLLHEGLNEGDTLYTILRHVSASGMRRHIDVYVIRDNEPVYLSGLVAKALGRTVNAGNHSGIVCNGTGMDMGFDLVYSVSCLLFGAYKLNHRWL